MSDKVLQPDGRPHLAYLVEGSDPGLVSQELVTLLTTLTGIDDAAIAPVEEYGAGGDDGFSIGSALDACRTPPFFEVRRIVVIRDVASMDSSQVAEVVNYLKEPLETTVLVLAHVGRSAPA